MSFAIDSGDPLFVPDPGETDFDGHARVLCDGVDIGAFEFGIGDIDCNGAVNLTDFRVWQACMTGPTPPLTGAGCEAFDFDADGDVDMVDYARFLAVFPSP